MYLETCYQNLQLNNGRFTIISGHFFAIYIKIFHKTEVQTILISSKVMKPNTNIAVSVFLKFCKKNNSIVYLFFVFFAFCIMTFEPISKDLNPLNTSKLLSEPQFCES